MEYTHYSLPAVAKTAPADTARNLRRRRGSNGKNPWRGGGAPEPSFDIKTDLAAAAAGLGGAKQTIEKDFYYEKSMDALVGTMNARRKEVLVAILRGLNTPSVEQYPFELALTRLHEYYMAGR